MRCGWTRTDGTRVGSVRYWCYQYGPNVLHCNVFGPMPKSRRRRYEAYGPDGTIILPSDSPGHYRFSSLAKAQEAAEKIFREVLVEVLRFGVGVPAARIGASEYISGYISGQGT